MGKSESAECSFNRIEAGQAQNIRSRQEENRGGAAGEVGEGEGAAEEGGVGGLSSLRSLLRVCGGLSFLEVNWCA